MTLGEKIVAIRKQKGWTQRTLARRAGIRPALLSELESGKKSDTTGLNLRKLAMALGVTTDYLTGLTPRPKYSPGVAPRLVGQAGRLLVMTVLVVGQLG